MNAATNVVSRATRASWSSAVFLGASRMRVVRSRDIKGAVTLRLSGVDNKTARPVPASLKTGRTFSETLGAPQDIRHASM